VFAILKFLYYSKIFSLFALFRSIWKLPVFAALHCIELTLKIQNSENRQLPDSSKTVEWKQFRGLDHFIIGGFIDTDLLRRGLAFGWFCVEEFVFCGPGVTA
jgi:hypothetical protein